MTTRVRFGEGFEAYAAADMKRLLRLAAMLTGDSDDASDLVQETLVRVGAAWSRVDRNRDPAGYATTVMTRLAWRQRRRRRTELSLLSSRASTEPADGGFHQVDDAVSLADAMRRLGQRQRAVLVLRFYCDLSEQQIAQLLGCSTGTVKSQSARGLANLRAYLDRRDRGHA